MHTYFFVIIKSRKQEIFKAGPYLNFKEAASIFVDHLESLAGPFLRNTGYIYEAIIAEYYLLDGELTFLEEKIKEKRKIQ